MAAIKTYIHLIRPHQYLKNLFVFSPLFFALKFNDLGLFEKTVVVFIIFCTAASAVYIINDIKDINEDKEHPVKKHRPLASGIISAPDAIVFMFFLAAVALTAAFFLSTKLFWVIVIYFILNLGYSFGLKHISIIDIFIVSIGFVLRIFAGAVTINLPVTMWIILMTFLLSLFLAMAKRRDDIIQIEEGRKTRKNIDGYNLVFVNSGMIIMAGVVIVCYIFYTISGEVQNKFHTNNLYLTVIFVILGIFRYMQITFVENNSGNPSRTLLKDRFLQITIIAWLIAFMIIVKT
jgi:decaprenyl-phosphate phosphoribosyltransferase